VADTSQQHWADAAAALLMERGGSHVINTGITPSGPIHVGNSREILTADAVHRAIQDAGGTSVLNYIADTYDPLRRVYPFLDDSYEEHVGKPLSAIPCPCGDHASYADHFLEPFLAGTRELGVDLTLQRAHDLYEKGAYADAIFTALEKRDLIARILTEVTGKEVAEGWSPFNALCGSCGRLGQSSVQGFDREAQTIRASCACGWEGDVSPAGGGKLTWRVDWPARWKILGCTFEPFGKDHATRGGSWDTGVRIAREVYDYEPPHYVLYEWISLKGAGDMSSSKGNVLSVNEMLEVAPPEVFRFYLMDRQPQKALALDPGSGVVTLIAEYDRRGREAPADRAYELSRIDDTPPCPVPFPHLVTSVQVATLAGKDVAAEPGSPAWRSEVLDVLARSGYPLEDEAEREATLRRARYSVRWTEVYAPPDMRFTLRQDVPAEVSALGEKQRAFARALSGRLEDGMDGQAVHDLIYELKD
jgi:lysyl-tRNA synthetase class 1